MYFVLFKQKTAYEMRISDWSSDVCSSDLGAGGMCRGQLIPGAASRTRFVGAADEFRAIYRSGETDEHRQWIPRPRGRGGTRAGGGPAPGRGVAAGRRRGGAGADHGGGARGP